MNLTKTDVSLSTNSLTLSVYRSFDEMEGMQADWDSLAVQSGGLIYQSFDWCRVWWKHYSKNRELRLLVFRNDKQWVAAIPLFIDYIGFRPIGIRVAKAISTEFSTSRFAPMVLGEYRMSVLEMACKQMLEKDACDLISIGPMTGAEAFTKDLNCAIEPLGFSASLHPTDAAVFMTYDLTDGFNGLMSRISSGRRANLRRSMRQVENCEGIVIQKLKEATQLEAEFETFCELHRLRWLAEGKQGHFNDWPDAKGFHKEMMVAQAKYGRCHLYKITRGNEVVAYEYGYAFGDWYFWLLPARSISEEWERLSIGQVSSLVQMRSEAEDGIRHADLGQGFYDYKKSMGANTEKLDRVLIAKSQTFKGTRFKYWQFVARFWNLFYYKLWFQRFRSRLHFPAKSIWPFWIRTRF